MPSNIQVDVDDVPKHERVAQALEQINGLRYRYKNAAAAKPQKKNINDDSDDGDDMTDDDDEEQAGGKSRRSDRQPLTLDDHIERMLLRTRTIALLKIANNTAEVLPDEDDEVEGDAEAYECGDDGFCEAYDENDDEEPFSGRTDDGYADEKSDRFDSVLGMASPPESHSSSMRRIGSMRRPMSFRTASFRSGGSTGGDPEEIAAQRLVRKLSTFLSLPKVISYKDLEEITESLLDEPHDESQEYAHLIDEHIDSARDSSSGDGSVAGDGATQHNSSSRTLANSRMVSKKSLRELNIVEDPTDLDLQQRRLYVENSGLVRYSSKRLIGMSSSNLLRGTSQLSMVSSGSSHGFGSMRQLGGSPSASSHDLMSHKESKRSLNRGESWRSGGAVSITEEADGKDDDDNDSDSMANGGLQGGVLGTTFDEEGYKEWRTEIKDDYLAWIRAKVEAKKLRRAQKQKDAGQKPRWLLLYEAASKGPRHGSEVEAMAADRKQSVEVPTRAAGRKSVI